jgi:PAS domain S-box-containing protein
MALWGLVGCVGVSGVLASVQAFHAALRPGVLAWMGHAGAGGGLFVGYNAARAEAAQAETASAAGAAAGAAAGTSVAKSRKQTDSQRRGGLLKDTRDWYRALVDNFPDGAVFVFDEDLRYQFAGGAGMEALGLTRADLVGATPHDVLPDALADQMAHFYRRALAGDTHTFEPPYQDRYYRVRTFPVRNDTGTVVSGMAISQDITRHRRRKQVLDRKRDLFVKAQALANVGGWEYDVRTGESTVTGQVHAIHGLPPDYRLTPPRSLAFYHPDDRPALQAAFAQAVKAGTSYDLEMRFVSIAREQRWVRTRGEPQTRDGDVIRVRGTLQDITSQKKREEALRRAKAEAETARATAEEASRLKTAMLANMSHEVRTPLTSINGFSEILKDELSGAQQVLAEQVYRSGHRLLRTLDSVLELSRLEARELPLEREQVQLDSVVTEATEMLRPQAQAKAVELVLSAPTPIIGAWNDNAIHRIAENLVGNAIKFTPDGGRVEVRVRSEGTTGILEVEDNGIGIGDEALPTIFEAFQQESQGLGREYEGSGLGLSIVKQLTEELGGTVEVRSMKGEGACFTVRLPVEAPPDGSDASPPAPA